MSPSPVLSPRRGKGMKKRLAVHLYMTALVVLSTAIAVVAFNQHDWAAFVAVVIPGSLSLLWFTIAYGAEVSRAH